MKTKTQTDSSPENRAIATPHFDSEVTLLSARPVVPLVDNNSKTQPWLWFLAGASAIVLVLVATTVVMQLRQRPVPAPKTTPVANSTIPEIEPPTEAQMPAGQPDLTGGPLEPEQIRASQHAGSDSSSKKIQSRPKVSVLARVAKGVPNIPEDALNSTVLAQPAAAKANTPDVPRPGPIRAPTPSHSEAPVDEALRQSRARRVRVYQRQEVEANRTGAGDEIFRIEEIFRGRRRP